MAIPHIRITCQQRSKGANAIAKAAYNSCSIMHLSGEELNYSRKRGLVYSELMQAPGQPLQSRQEFWEAVEKSETRKNSTVSRELVIGLPLELDRTQRQALAQEFAKEILTKFNLPAVDISIHEPTKRKKNAASQENPHGHLHFPDRNSQGKKIRELQKPETVTAIRHLWEKTINHHLAAAGIEARISVETLEKQIEKTEAQLQTVETEIQTLKTEIRKLKDGQREIEDLNARRSDPSPEPAGPGQERHRESPRPDRSNNQANEQRHPERLANHRPTARPADQRRTGTKREHSHSRNSRTNPQPRAENQPIRIEFEAVEEKLKTLIKIQDLKTLHPNPIQDLFKRIAQKLREYIRLTDETHLARIIEDERYRTNFDHPINNTPYEDDYQAPSPHP